MTKMKPSEYCDGVIFKHEDQWLSKYALGWDSPFSDKGLLW